MNGLFSSSKSMKPPTDSEKRFNLLFNRFLSLKTEMVNCKKDDVECRRRNQREASTILDELYAYNSYIKEYHNKHIQEFQDLIEHSSEMSEPMNSKFGGSRRRRFKTRKSKRKCNSRRRRGRKDTKH